MYHLSQNHGSETIVVTLQIQPFSTFMIMEGRVQCRCFSHDLVSPNFGMFEVSSCHDFMGAWTDVFLQKRIGRVGKVPIMLGYS